MESHNIFGHHRNQQQRRNILTETESILLHRCAHRCAKNGAWYRVWFLDWFLLKRERYRLESRTRGRPHSLAPQLHTGRDSKSATHEHTSVSLAEVQSPLQNNCPSWNFFCEHVSRAISDRILASGLLANAYRLILFQCESIPPPPVPRLHRFSYP